MTRSFIDYSQMVEGALRSVVRQVLVRTAENGLPGNHHFFITFKTEFPGVEMPDYLRSRFPEEMTIVLQHQYWGLEAGLDNFTVTLSFNKVNERLIIPYGAVSGFADPSVQFGLQFRPGAGSSQDVELDAPQDAAPEAEKKSGEVVALDAFRKK